MNRKMSEKEISDRANAIQAVYQEYAAKLNDLKKKQSDIINRFIKELEQRKIEEIKKILK